MKFNWHNEKRRIKDLVPYVANPRQITEKQAKDLKASLERFGVADPLIINTDNTIIGGHQRKKILETLMGIDPDYEIDVRVPDRELSIDEMRELNVRLNKNQGEWNFDTLANNFELDDLLDWGFKEYELGVVKDFENEDIWEGMPEYNNENLHPEQSITVNFNNREDVENFAKLINQKITDKTRSIWYPERPEELVNQLGTGMVFTDES